MIAPVRPHRWTTGATLIVLVLLLAAGLFGIATTPSQAQPAIPMAQATGLAATQSNEQPPLVPTPTPEPPRASEAVATSTVDIPAGVPYRITGYGWRDNSCGGGNGGPCIAYPSKGRPQAGGDGTYDNPVSLAVQVVNRKPIYPAGTRFYLVDLHRYGIVEDYCGACVGHFLDVWVDGSSATKAAAEACMRAITGTHNVVENPPRGLPVRVGVISTAAGCAT